MSLIMPEPMSTHALKRAESIPSSSGVAIPPALPPSPTGTLPTYTWDVAPPSPDLKAAKQSNSPPSPVLSYTATFLNEAAPNGHGEHGNPEGGPTYIFWVIPSRIGVAIFASLMFICSIGMAVSAALIANRLEGNLTPVQRLAIIFQILNYLFVSVASLVGFYAILTVLHRNAISPLSRGRKAATLFCGLLLGHLPFSVASGALSIHIVFKATNRALRAGILKVETAKAAEAGTLGARGLMWLMERSSSEGPASKPLACSVLEGTPLYWMCKKTKLIKALIIILYLALWFLEVVALYAGTKYSNELHSAEMIKNVEDEESADY